MCISVEILMQKDVFDPNKAASRRSQRYFCQTFQRWSNSPEIGHAANKTFFVLGVGPETWAIGVKKMLCSILTPTRWWENSHQGLEVACI